MSFSLLTVLSRHIRCSHYPVGPRRWCHQVFELWSRVSCDCLATVPCASLQQAFLLVVHKNSYITSDSFDTPCTHAHVETYAPNFCAIILARAHALLPRIRTSTLRGTLVNGLSNHPTCDSTPNLRCYLIHMEYITHSALKPLTKATYKQHPISGRTRTTRRSLSTPCIIRQMYSARGCHLHTLLVDRRGPTAISTNHSVQPVLA